MIETHYAWQPAVVSDATVVEKFKQALNVPEIIVKLLMNRGITTLDEMQSFLQPSYEQINDPMLLHDMDKLLDRVNEAVINGEHITIYGDYDADGITSTALLYETLMTFDADVDYYVPNRFTDGYGPNKAVYERLIKQGTQLIITVDNGVAGHEAIEYANAQGVDVIITDHHELPAKLPDAYAIVHPQHPDGQYPFKHLSGVGVAFKVATALFEEVPEELFDLVAIGEIADLVPLVGENRTLVTYGLQMIANTNRPGLKALMDIANISSQEVTAEKVSFGLAPRLNAIGRLQSAALGVDLLVTQDANHAQQLAQQVDALNTERKQIVTDILIAAKQQLEHMPIAEYHALVLAGDNWHEGVLGIVASQIVEATGRPTIILSREDGMLKGSARGIPSFNVFTALNAHAELFTAFGGHAGAAGMSLPDANLDALQTAFNAEAQYQAIEIGVKTPLPIEATLNISEINDQLYDAISKLEPFGNSNPQPIFEVTGSVSGIKQIGAENNHLKFNLIQGDAKLPAIAFGYGDLGNGSLVDKSTLAIVGTLSQNTWQGQTTIQMMVKDLQQSGIAIIDQRINKLRPDTFALPGQYVFFNHKVKQQLEPYLTSDSTAVSLSNGEKIIDNQTTILVDLPTSMNDLNILKEHQYKELRAIFYTSKHVYLENTPSKTDFAHFYKYCLGHTNIPIRAELEKLSKYLHLSENQLSLMITVFFELGFVRIENGVLNALPNPKHADLTTAPSYQAWIAKQSIEKSLIYSKTSELIELLTTILTTTD